ncbi:MAG: protein kinase [Myxococcales bacterium]|nr:protein kinase [Myxococcales bacterium]
MASAPTDSRYATLLKLASGGMATVWIGTARGGMGFRQLVAIKKPHPHLLDRAELRAELLAEAALASSIRHVNVVDVRDVEVCDGAISLVMDYIEGASLSELLTSSLNGGPRITPAVAVRIALDALAGLHAAHELVDDRGKVVGLVHRDVSPQNILVGLDGVARVVDFGVAKFEKKGTPRWAGSSRASSPTWPRSTSAASRSTAEWTSSRSGWCSGRRSPRRGSFAETTTRTLCRRCSAPPRPRCRGSPRRPRRSSLSSRGPSRRIRPSATRPPPRWPSSSRHSRPRRGSSRRRAT